MPLPKLVTLGKSPAVRAEQARLKMPAPLPTPKEVPIEVVSPFYNQWEMELHAFFVKQNPYWVAQWQLGTRGQPGSTSADELNQMLKVAFYLDGPVHQFRDLQGRDMYLRAQWRGLGYRVVAWAPPTLQYLRDHMYEWYWRDINGYGVL